MSAGHRGEKLGLHLFLLLLTELFCWRKRRQKKDKVEIFINISFLRNKNHERKTDLISLMLWLVWAQSHITHTHKRNKKNERKTVNWCFEPSHRSTTQGYIIPGLLFKERDRKKKRKKSDYNWWHWVIDSDVEAFSVN